MHQMCVQNAQVRLRRLPDISLSGSQGRDQAECPDTGDTPEYQQV